MSKKELDRGTLSFSIESRILRELGERLVKQPEVAVIELVKNAYDADAVNCRIDYDEKSTLEISDDGGGMTLSSFEKRWMRIGTSSKEKVSSSKKFGRLITGEKGIGRFAVRFLGRNLHLESISFDRKFGCRTKLIADFDWPKFDQSEDLGKVHVPYQVVEATDEERTGTTLTITRLRQEVSRLDLKRVRTGSLGILSPVRSLLRIPEDETQEVTERRASDPGFKLKIASDDGDGTEDVALDILNKFVLRARLHVRGERLSLRIYKRDEVEPYFKIVDKVENHAGEIYSDIRWFPRRAGTFRGMAVDGRVAQSWVIDNGGVAVFDRYFRVQPYGTPSDDWLQLQADVARRRREPRSPIAQKHFPMTSQVKASTAENWMLRLPQSAQLVGIVQVDARRAGLAGSSKRSSLIASADREGFVENLAFTDLRNAVRGAIEAMAYCDRRIQQEEERLRRRTLIASIRSETRSAIEEIQTNPNLTSSQKTRIVSALAETQELAKQHEQETQEKERQLEVMSLLGVVAGFMTHEFGVALDELEKTYKELLVAAKIYPKLSAVADSFSAHIKNLQEFVRYSTGYIEGAKIKPTKSYRVRPRLSQVKKVFGKYAEDRGINVEIDVDGDLLAPLVPASLYNGLALNLFTNALKAVAARAGKKEGTVRFHAWNQDGWHFLEVLDTGIGIPSALHRRVFDPLFTTTAGSNRDPLGSGMGLGLALVQRSAEAFGGRVQILKAPEEFSTRIQIRLPLKGGEA